MCIESNGLSAAMGELRCAFCWGIAIVADGNGSDVTDVFMPPTIRGALRGLFGTSIRQSGDETVRLAYLQ